MANGDTMNGKMMPRNVFMDLKAIRSLYSGRIRICRGTIMTRSMRTRMIFFPLNSYTPSPYPTMEENSRLKPVCRTTRIRLLRTHTR